ncbi:RING/FYVE/PHD zinc finger superfamily protein [Euphorbia peplus]|nr:RING/FYVE/PHD zinc finger superfamily protein [Euphorbia peplus]
MATEHHLSTEMSFSGEIGAHRNSDCLSEVDLEGGKVHLKSDHHQRDCRICHLGLENGVAFELGCSCKGDLGSAHKKCAETWFKIKGNTICEICGVTALNVSGEQANETQSTAATAAVSSAPAAPTILVETRTFWHSRRVMNFLLACMVFAFVISWLFHFKILS